jgi:hypothetical protein
MDDQTPILNPPPSNVETQPGNPTLPATANPELNGLAPGAPQISTDQKKLEFEEKRLRIELKKLRFEGKRVLLEQKKVKFEEEKVGIEQKKVKFEADKVDIEKQKLRLEKKRTWITVVAVGIAFLAPILSAFITYKVTTNLFEQQKNKESEQAKLRREQAFTDDMNKSRVLKISEVFEKFFMYAAAVDTVTDQLDKKGDNILIKSDIKPNVDKAKDLKTELDTILVKNKFWLPKELFEKIRDYANTSFEYFLSKPKDVNPEEWRRQREETMHSFEEIRDSLLNGTIR